MTRVLTIFALVAAWLSLTISTHSAEASVARYTLPFFATHSKTQGFHAGHAGNDYQLGNFATGGDAILAARTSVSGGTAAKFQAGPGGYGHYLEVSHGSDHGQSLLTLYAHLASAGSSGATVQRGQTIGAEGNSGGPWCQQEPCSNPANWSSPYHLHFETHVNGVPVDPESQWSTSTPSHYQGTDTAGVFRDSDHNWYISNNHMGTTHAHFAYGQSGDLPVAGAWAGGHPEGIGVSDGIGNVRCRGAYPCADKNWKLRYNAGGGSPQLEFAYGQTGDTPIVGDWNGDGVVTPGITRTENGQLKWHLSNSTTGANPFIVTFGSAGDKPVVGDWDGDGDDELGVYRGNTFKLHNCVCGGSAYYADFSFGQSGDTPLAADWDGDNVDTVGVRRGNTWYLKNTPFEGGGHDVTYGFGTASDKPTAGDWDAQ